MMPLVFAETGKPQIIRKIGETVSVVKLHGEALPGKKGRSWEQ